MATGSVSSLGVGSGLQLQSMLEQLRGVDEQVITRKKNEVTTLESQLNEFTVVNNKLLTMKSAALGLSLSSTFLSRTVSSSSTSVLGATVADGTAVQATAVTVDRIATKSTFMSGGVASETAKIYVPTTQESTTGVADPAVDNIAPADGTLVISYGGSSTITVPTGPTATVTTMNQLVLAINNDAENVGTGANGRMVTASTYVLNGQTYLRVASDTVGATGEAHRVGITTNNTTLAFTPPKKTFAINLGTKSMVLSVAADTTMSQLRDQINSSTSNPGVTASIINDGSATNPYKLVLKANTTGKDNEISMLAQVPDLTMTVQGQTGTNLNAQITIDGVSYQRQTNAISDVLAGITLNLQAAGTSTVSVANNDAAIKDMIVGLVDAYNAAVQEISQNTKYDETTKDFGMLARTTLRDLPYALQNFMTTSIKADSKGLVTNLFDIGLEFNRDGTITIDETALSAAVSAAPASVSAFFLGDEANGVTGFADTVNDYLREVTGGSGQINAEKTAAQTRIDDMQLQIENTTARIDKRYDILTKQFVALDQYMSQMKSMGSYLTGQFDSLSNMLSGSSK
ncbi:MAG: flagellar filament capping protein FliD [Desulfurivibrionaceae bacterium]|jgi:flagellar hook-associated protein 2